MAGSGLGSAAERRPAAPACFTNLASLCNFEFRTYFTPWETASGPGQSAASGIGDTWMTGQYRFHAQTRNLPALSIQYTLKQPTADSQNGLGSGQRDHIIAISAGKDFKQTSFNFETKYMLFGQSNNQPFSRYREYSLNATHALMRHFSLTSEIYADTRSSTNERGPRIHFVVNRIQPEPANGLRCRH